MTSRVKPFQFVIKFNSIGSHCIRASSTSHSINLGESLACYFAISYSLVSYEGFVDAFQDRPLCSRDFEI